MIFTVELYTDIQKGSFLDKGDVVVVTGEVRFEKVVVFQDGFLDGVVGQVPNK